MPNLFSLEGRLALVTGSGQGIGFALAKGLARHGAAVVLNGRTAEKIDRAVAALRSEGQTAHGAVFDVVDAAAVQAEVERIEKEMTAIAKAQGAVQRSRSW